MRLLVCGSRSWPAASYDQIHVGLDLLVSHLRARGMGDVSVLIHGAALGVDSYADRWARFWELPAHAYPIRKPDWALFGKRAGRVRNERMLRDGRPDIVVAFRMPGISNGTDHMLRIAREAGVNTLELPWKPEGLKDVRVLEVGGC